VSHVQELTLHLGLPKTATTTLQTHVFPRFSGYLGKYYGDDGAPPSSEWATWHSAYEKWLRRDPEWRDALRVWVATLKHAGHSSAFLSDEALSAWSDGAQTLWPVTDDWVNAQLVRPHPVIELLRTIKEFAGESMRLRVILTLRNQPSLIGSLYAELQLRMASPGQADLEAKIAHL
jgi:hypothetical protein